MGFAEWFSRPAAGSAAPPADLRDRLIAAVTAKDLSALARLFRSHRDAIRDQFPNWTTVPAAMERDPARLATHGEMLIAVARLFEQEGDPALMEALRGDPVADPIESWNAVIARVQELMAAHQYELVIAELTPVLALMAGLRGSAVDFYRPRMLGKLGIARYQCGDVEGALAATREARDVCERIGDEEGVSAYSANLAAMSGDADPAATPP